jgi:hypothetical protein
LTTEGCAALETLHLLAKKATQILSCGTCLEYYHLEEKLQVAVVTAMYDTVDAMLSAIKVLEV